MEVRVRFGLSNSWEGIAGPTWVAPVGQTLWMSEGQLPHLFEAAKNGPPRLPFRVVGVPVNK